MLSAQNQRQASRSSSPSRSQNGSGAGGTSHFAPFPSSFRIPQQDHTSNPTLVNIQAPTPLDVTGASSFSDFTPTGNLPNSSFPLADPSSTFASSYGASSSFVMDSDLLPSSFFPNDFDASDVFKNFLDGQTSGLSPFPNNNGDVNSSFLDFATLQASMDMDTGGIVRPFDFDPAYGGGATSDSEGYISSAASTDGSSMRIGPYFASRKRPSEDVSSSGPYLNGGGGTGPVVGSKPRKTRSLKSSSRSTSKQDLPIAFGTLGGHQDFPPKSSSNPVPPQAKRRKSFTLADPNSSNSPPSPSSNNHASTSGLVLPGGESTEGPLRRTNSNPLSASFAFAQPTPAQNTVIPHFQSISPQQPSLNGHRPQPFPSSSVPNFPSSSGAPSFHPVRSRHNSATSSSSYSNNTHHQSPASSAASSSGVPSLGLNPVVETSLEWVPSKPRIRKSIRRRLEKKRDEPQRMVHVLEGHPPPTVEVNLPKISFKGKGSKKGKGRLYGGSTAGEESGTEGGGKGKKKSSSSLSSKKNRLDPMSSLDGPSMKLKKGKGKKGEAALESDGESSDEDDLEDVEDKMARMLRSFEHLGTELPPRVFVGGVSPLMPEKKKKKIPGSAMDRLPAIEARFDALETGIKSYMQAVARRSLQNSMLPSLYFPPNDVQQVWTHLGGVGAYEPHVFYDDDADDEED